MSSLSLPSPSHALVDEASKQIPLVRKLLLLLILCFAQILDSFSISSVFSALPVLEKSLNIPTSQGVWIISGNQLTFASTLLIVRLVALCCYQTLPYSHTQSGRISDVYGPSELSDSLSHTSTDPIEQ